MYVEKDKEYVEAIKMAAGSLHYRNLPIKETLINTVRQLDQYYKMYDNSNYLEIALLHIQAYLEMGLPYDEGRIVFDKILKKLDIAKEIMFPRRLYQEKKIKLNKSQVRGMIGKWPASPHQNMKINDVVNDIITKIEEKRIGIYYYKSVVMNEVYELVINEKEIFFHDIKKRIFYTFVS